MAKNRNTSEGGTATEEKPAVDRKEILKRATAGKPAAEKLQIAAMMQSLGDEDLVEMFGDNLASLTLDSNLAGRPLHNWLGKTKGQILRELEDFVVGDPNANPEDGSAEDLYEEIEEALTGKGWVIGDEPVIRKVDEIFVEIQLRGSRGMTPPMRNPDGSLADVNEMLAKRQAQAAKRGGVGGRRAGTRTTEPTFGDDQIPLSEFPDTVEEIMARRIKGVGPSTAEKIVALRTEAGMIGQSRQTLPPSALGPGDTDANPLVAPPIGGQGASELQPQRGPEGQGEE